MVSHVYKILITTYLKRAVSYAMVFIHPLKALFNNVSTLKTI